MSLLRSEKGPMCTCPVSRKFPKDYPWKRTSARRLKTKHYRLRMAKHRPHSFFTLFASGDRCCDALVCLCSESSPCFSASQPFQVVEHQLCSLCLLVYLLVNSLWLQHSQGCSYTMVFAAEECAWPPTTYGAPFQTFFSKFNRICENDGTGKLCATLRGQLPYRMRDYFYVQWQTGGGDFAEATVFVCGVFVLLDGEAPSKVVPGDWAIWADHFAM